MLRKSTSWFLVILLFGYLAVFFLQRRIDRTIGEYHQTEDILFLPSGKVVKKLSLGYASLMADIYWIRAIQYYGGGRIMDPNRNFDLLAPLLNITTTLDPSMIPAYQFGAVFLSEPPPIGAGNPQAAIRLLDKGIAANRETPDLYLSLGFVYYWQLKNYKEAAQVFLEGAKYQKGRPWLRNLAAYTLMRGGDRSTSKYLWEQIYETSENKRAKENALAHLLELRAEDQMEALRRVVDRFKKENGRFPRSFVELATRGYLRGIPLDPTGAPYRLDAESGKIMVSADTKLPIPPK